MKKEYIVLIVLIIALGAYLGLKKDGRMHYELPALAAVDTGKIDRLEIKKGDQVIILNRKNKTWTLTDKAFPADKASVDNMLDTIRDLKLSALVSETSDQIRYELDRPNAVHVTAFSGQEQTRSFIVGKTAPSFKHTFVMLANDKRVYQADKNFRDQFDKSMDDFRDKLVMEFKPGAIKTIRIEKQDLSATLTLVETPAETPDKPEEKTTDKDKESPVKTWQLADGKAADKEAVSNLMSSLSRLECQHFLQDKPAEALEGQTPQCKIILEGKEPIRLDLFAKDTEDAAAAKASTSDYAFALASYKAEDILSYVDKLLGIEKPQP